MLLVKVSHIHDKPQAGQKNDKEDNWFFIFIYLKIYPLNVTIRSKFTN